MLVLTRKAQQQIQIGEHVTLTIVRVKGQTVRIGIEAPKEVRVIRSELADAPQRSTIQPCRASSKSAEPAMPVAAEAACSVAETGKAASCTDTSSECTSTRRRMPGASSASSLRRPTRMGPTSLYHLACRAR